MVQSMNIGVSSPAFALEPVSKTIEKVADIGKFEVWEIVADLKQLLPKIAPEVKQFMQSYDIDVSIHAPFNDLNLGALNLDLRILAIKYIKDTIETAANLGIGTVSFHPGHLCPSGIYAPDKVKEANLTSIRELAKFAKDFDITLALENMPMKFWTLGNRANDILEMIDNTDFGICFDIGHAFIMDEIDNFLNSAQTAPINNIHIHDNMGRRDEHLALGEGKIDLPYVLKRLAPKYSGNIIIECNNIEEGLKSKEYLEKLLK